MSRHASMGGNRLGWGIAAGLAVLVGVGVWQLLDVNRLTPPTDFARDPAVLSPLATEISPDVVCRAPPGGDAGALYRRAVDDVVARPSAYAAAGDATDPAEIERLPAVASALAAAGQSGGDAITADAAAYVRYAPDPDRANALSVLPDALLRAGLLRAESDPAAARRDDEAAFAFGRRLFDERPRYAEASLGAAVMDQAAGGLGDLARRQGDGKRAAVLDAFCRSLEAMTAARLVRPWNVIASKDPASLGRHAGDAFAIAGPGTGERMWRAEAILKLGQYRFNAVRLADQLAVPRRLRELRAGETDPVVLAAVHAAETLTIEQYRMLPE